MGRAAHPIVLIVGGLALSLVVLYELPRAAPEQVPWVWVGAGAFGAASLLGVLLLAANRPRLVLGHDFLEYKTPFRTHRWRWEDVGAFEVSEREVARRFRHTPLLFARSIRFYYACAYSDRNHDVLQASGRSSTPTWEDADITIPLRGFRIGDVPASAEALVAALNRFRARHGRPEVAVDSEDPTRTLAALARRRQTRRLASPELIVGAVVVFFVIALLIG